MKGNVYAVQNEDLVKIGRSFRPSQRIKALQTQGGFISGNIFISEASYLYSKVELQCHAKLSKLRVVGEWFRIDFADAVKCINDVMAMIATDEAEKAEEAKIDGLSGLANAYFYQVEQLKVIRDGMISAEWTAEAIEFSFSLGLMYAKRIYDELFMSPCVTLIGDESIWLCYPNGFDEHDKDQYVASYDKKAIATDIGCSMDDVPDWDDYSVIIEEQHRLAA
ncbi:MULTISPECIES: GIY-YIG nuclease family protein [Yersinia]|uniref:Bacteriophage T5 Orf172 DNA-binding domain-containing protein n=1 Tax=Yersinia intermedia TaxID=631 RepID=A0A209A5G0_YERIN|nr:GIY-YIG nuclease family protein [Yersinia intermedia]HDL6896997.1 GIY-YIG nuclease family protein [Yersinia enterocolitica]MCB5324521.1 GIY-YIG nuclease family protein [Yersinia intermedia]OVZ87935.1 hypothetical protein CBW57_06685 [Yersinia intermedia]HDL8226846.1 GIY-YIG nuclease family protein [Yersinia enterocolitica]HDL8462708.1 GIY-YIG nuclease family protein [Yersinia enterocolitica]